MRVFVSYPWRQPPIITDITTIPNTLDGDRQFQVSAHISDDGSIEETYLMWSIDSTAPTDSIAMTAINDSIYAGEFNPRAQPNDTVYYWIGARDDEGLYNCAATDAPYHFVVKPRHNPNAEVLLLDTQDTTYYGDYMQYLALSDSLDIPMEYWNIQNNNGLEPGVIQNQSWKCIFLIGHAVIESPILKAKNDNIWRPALDTGIHLIVIHQYLFDSGDTTTFVPGDIGYDYFGIHQIIGTRVNNDFNSIRGISGDILTGFAADSFYVLNQESADYIKPALASSIWVTEENRITGIRNQYDDTKTVGLLFPIEHFNSYDYKYNPPVLAPVFTQFFVNLFNWMDIPVNIDKHSPSTFPETVILYPNFPNPFNNSTTLRFYLPKTSDVVLEVYDITGRVVASVIRSRMKSGIHQLDWIPRSPELASGIYFLRLQSGTRVLTRKMVLLK